MVTQEIRNKVNQKIEDCYALLKKTFPNHNFIRRPQIQYKQLGRKSGLAYYQKYLIEINSDFFIDHEEDIINKTVPHELAHLVAYELYQERGIGHNSYWKYIMRCLGLIPKRCHNYSLENVKTKGRNQSKRYVYSCPCGDKIQITSNRITKILNGHSYKHTSCGQKIDFTIRNRWQELVKI